MDITRKNIMYTNFVIKGKQVDNYSKIYFASNEKLDKIFSNVDIKDKNVLTVLGSGDQAFHLYNRGARHVDVFDKNKLTLFYYYLRRWVIQYLNTFYPETNLRNIYIKKLLKKVEPRTIEELDAYNYWSEYINFFEAFNTEKLLLKSFNYSSNEISDLSIIKKKIEEDDFSFYDFDISGDISLDKKYDIIYKSNISDHIAKEKAIFEKYRDNLYDLLEDDGVIVSSNVVFKEPSNIERVVFSEKFDFQMFPGYIHSLNDPSRGYVYKKKMLT